MGGRSSKGSTPHNRFSDANGPYNNYAAGRTLYQPNDFKSNSAKEDKSNTQSNGSPSQGRKSVEKQPHEWKQLNEPSLFPEIGTTGYGSSEDDFYDGIPRFPRALSQKSRSRRSKQTGLAKIRHVKILSAAMWQGSEAGSRLGKPRSLRLGKAVEVLDSLGSSVTSLNQSSGFVSGVKTKGSELQILAFEVANTIVKGSSLMKSISKWSIRQLKEVVFTSEGVQCLVSKDMNELLATVAADKRRSKELAPQNQLQEEAEQKMQQLMTLVIRTADLYNEMQAIDKLSEQDCQRKRLEDDNPYATQRGDSLSFLRTDLKSQRKLVKNLKQKSLWSRSLEEVMEKLVDIVLFLNREIQNVFGSADCDKPAGGSLVNQQRLGPSGLALHYANIVIQIDTIVARCNSMPSSLRESLYQGLPPNMKASLRSKLLSFHVKDGLTATEIKDEMEKTLQWLVPMAINTAKAHHGFGWVGEWANTGSGANRKPAGPIDVIQIETFHYADKEKSEACIIEQLLWLNHLIKQTKVDANGGEKRMPMRSPSHKTLGTKDQNPVPLATSAPSPKRTLQTREQNPVPLASSALSTKASTEDEEKLQDVSNESGHKE
ncbi:hypothetical protein RHGRI_008938 [Rhododendron griersonianum]|uniref:Uncharacterized protein n=1 Tax=Rhododendron griersonianum TaxID=479676 RepID=A0AAV6L3N9_9ERIC|nr:hypothetical protein RHGRI_008938 [Rhododendron griersonianum]KAG5559189.1 hypothetical protein RHGRI_008938 [Rhododendron griersonianum]